jgi:hypothetical protein
MKQLNAMQRMCAEQVTYGNALYTRSEIVREMTVLGHSKRAIDFFAFHGNALTDRQIAAQYEQGNLINAIANVFPAWYEEARWTI